MPKDAITALEYTLPDLWNTVYKRQAHIEEAPTSTDCLTSIHYLLSRALSITIPLTFVGDMPRSLVSSGWTFHIIDTTQMRTADLIFLKRREASRLLVHAALVLDVDRIFHCRKDIGMVVESPNRVFELYEQQVWNDQLLYIDYRNEQTREKNAGCYMNKSAATFLCAF